MRIVATIQARMGSLRLPGKVLLPILGRPMLAHQVERIQRSTLIDEIVIATSIASGDDPVEALAKELGVGCFRGSEEDVLARVTGAVKTSGADAHVEFMGDNPMPDPMLIDATIGYYLKHAAEYDYVTNAITTTYPPGFEVSVYPASVLVDAEAKAPHDGEREHVGIHIYQHPGRYRVSNLEAPPWLRFPDMHLEVDTPEDFEVVRAVFEGLHPTNPGFGIREVIDFLVAHPELSQTNSGMERRWEQYRESGA